MAFSLDQVLALEPYSLGKAEKRALYTRALSELTRTHAENCWEYRRILEVLGHDCAGDSFPEGQPMLPVRLFKRYNLCSVPREEVAKVMTSSGTSGQQLSSEKRPGYVFRQRRGHSRFYHVRTGYPVCLR